MPTDKKISELPVASVINATDTSLIVSNNADYQYSFTLLLQFLEANLSTGAKVSFGTTLPQNISGNNGDVFINTSAGSFAQKISGTWIIVYTLTTGNADGTMLYGPGIPGNSTGKNSDSYINTLTGIFYKKAFGEWAQVFSMATGPQGPQGGSGTNGTNGKDGNTILFGDADPSNTATGIDGNFYLNKSTYTLFGPKASGIWNNGVSIIGAGVATAGTAGQVLVKADSTNYNTYWDDNSFANLSGQPVDNANMLAALNLKANTNDVNAALADKQALLSYTPENSANKNQPGGYAGLDSGGKVPSAQLPGFVDEILEFSNLASFPATGDTGVIYVASDTNFEYRWSGSSYVQLVASPGSTDAVPEGSTNLYFKASRVLAVILTGIGFSATSAVAATDSILIAIGKLQAQINSLTESTLPGSDTFGQALQAAIQAAPVLTDEAAAVAAGLSAYSMYKTDTGELRYKLPTTTGRIFSSQFTSQFS